jgi:hypothetical protein
VAVFDSEMEKKLAVGFHLGLDVYKVTAYIPLRTCSRREVESAMSSNLTHRYVQSWTSVPSTGMVSADRDCTSPNRLILID